jgi:anaerobic magnesium-protoporphyrin IX monomethyl ester cyclase
MPQMKIILIFKSDFMIIPIGIRTLCAVLKHKGHNVEIIDIKLEKNYFKNIIKFNPDIIGFSVDSFSWNYFREFNTKLKTLINYFSVFGGPHATLTPQIINLNGIDAVCVGEGEEAFVELADKLNTEEICTISNLWVKKDGKIFENSIRNLIPNLDILPHPDIDILKKYKAYRKFTTYDISTSRGCPYNCPYCINHFYRHLFKGKGKYVRRRSVDNVIEELIIAKKELKLKTIFFVDELFTFDKKWLDNFAPKYIKHINLPFEVLTRIDDIEESTISLLCKMGFKVARVGIESGNEELRFNVLKRKITDKQIIDNSKLLHKNKLTIFGYNMLGLPGEDINKAFETLELNAKCKITYPMTFMFHPFPNIDLTQYSINENFLTSNSDNFSKLSNKCEINLKDKKQIERLYYLFYLGVKFPFTIPIIKVLVVLPLNAIYFIIFHAMRAFIILFIIKSPPIVTLLNYYPRKWYSVGLNKLSFK